VDWYAMHLEFCGVHPSRPQTVQQGAMPREKSMDFSVSVSVAVLLLVFRQYER